MRATMNKYSKVDGCKYQKIVDNYNNYSIIKNEIKIF